MNHHRRNAQPLSLGNRQLLIDGLTEDSIALATYLARFYYDLCIVVPTAAEHPAAWPFDPTHRVACRTRMEIDFRRPGTLFVNLSTPRHDPLIKLAEEYGNELSNLADVILRAAPGPTVGVTGTAGKTTTTFLLSSMLSAAAIPAHATTDDRLTPSGPGQAMLAAIDKQTSKTWSVLELTSHHLDYVNVSPAIAVVTNLFPDHQDWHGTYDAYRIAKERLVRFQDSNDVAILNFDDSEVRTGFAAATRARIRYFSAKDEIATGAVVANGWIAIRTRTGVDRICHLDDLAMPSHHVPSALAATAAAVEAGARIDAIGDALRAFRGLPQRRQFVGRVGPVEIYDDSMAMNPRKAIAGLDSFGDRSLIVVSGGATRSPSGEKRVASELEKRDLKRYCALLPRKALAVVHYGEGGKAIRAELDAVPTAALTVVEEASFEHAVRRAATLARDNGKVLISPIYFNVPGELTRTLERVVSGLDASFDSGAPVDRA